MKEEVKNCIGQAERFLVLREHNKNELIDKLKNKEYKEETINEAIQFLIESDELNESRYIQAFVKSSNRKHPEGKMMVLTRLISKKANKDLSKQILEEIYTEEYTQNLISEALKKVEKKAKNDDFYAKKQALMKLGFQSSDIRSFFELNA